MRKHRKFVVGLDDDVECLYGSDYDCADALTEAGAQKMVKELGPNMLIYELVLVKETQ